MAMPKVTKRRKKFDDHAALFKRYMQVCEEASYHRKQMTIADNEKKELIAEIKSKMGRAVIGLIAGMPAFELTKGSRSTATNDRVKQFAPEQYDNIVQKTEWDVIKPL